MGRKSVSLVKAHSSSMEKAAGWMSAKERERREEVENILSSSMNSVEDQTMVSTTVHLKPAVRPLEPLNEDQPAKFPMPALSILMETAQHQATSTSKGRPNKK